VVISDGKDETKSDIKKNVKSTTETQTEKQPKPEYKCIKASDNVRIYTYIFHYIIPDKFVDPKNKVEY
jgi:hypothetical protein